MKKNWESNRNKMSYSKIWGNTVRGSLVKILWNSPCVTVLWKLLLLRSVSLWRVKVGWDRVAYWLERCQ